jgi:hypothetical protein
MDECDRQLVNVLAVTLLSVGCGHTDSGDRPVTSEKRVLSASVPDQGARFRLQRSMRLVGRSRGVFTPYQKTENVICRDSEGAPNQPPRRTVANRVRDIQFR